MATIVRTNYIRHLNSFFAQVRKDNRLRANHVSLYTALFQVWNQYHFQHAFPILREEVINLCRIGSRSTYVQCLKDLHAYGYIIYQPASQPYAPSFITINKLTDASKEDKPIQLSLFQDVQVENTGNRQTGLRSKNEPQTRPENGPCSGPKVGHIINKQINNNKKGGENANTPPKKNNTVKSSKSKPQKTNEEIKHPAALAIPETGAVHQFFKDNGYPAPEALKFYYHYQANGWKQGSKTSITNWQYAAHKWMLNIHPQKSIHHDTRKPKPGKLHTDENKSYSEPL